MSYAVFSNVDNLSYSSTYYNMTSPIVSLLGTEKLNGENYALWKNTINTILVINNLKFVLTEDCPPVPGPHVPRNVLAKKHDKVRVYIQASLTEVLAKMHETMLTAREIMESLVEMFGQPSSQLRHDALKFIFNTRMNEESSVRQHVLNMMTHFNVAKMNGVVIDEANQVSFILESLPKSFLQFCSNVVSTSTVAAQKDKKVMVAKGICFHCNREEEGQRR